MNDLWFLEETAYHLFIDALSKADFSAVAPATPDNLIDGSFLIDDQGVAIIPVVGIMSKGGEGALIRMLLGESTSYNGLIAVLSQAEASDKVRRAELHFDTPGGNVNGSFDAAKAIKNFSKPIDGIITGQAASAGYLLAAQTDKIVARNPSDMVGSIGVVTRRRISDTIIDISSTDAPLKVPDASTNEGIKVIRQELDMLHGHLVNGIAEGRKTDAAIVNSEFGRGGMMTADVGLHRGMIDAIEDGETSDDGGGENKTIKVQGIGITLENDSKNKGGTLMSLTSLLGENADAKREHDEIVAAAVVKATADERVRVSAHLENIGHSKDAVIKAIKEGVEFDAAAHSVYMNAAIKLQHGSAAAGDNPDDLDTDDGVDAAGAEAAAKDKALDQALDSAVATAGDSAFKF